MPAREHFPPSQKVLPPPRSFHPLQTLRGLRRRNRRRPIVVPSGAPTTSEYLLLAAESLLPNARIFSVSGLLVAIDGGPGSSYDVGLDQSDLVLANLTDLDTELQAEYIAKAVLTANGDLLYRAAGVPDNLTIGSNGDQLTVVAGLPAWVTPATPTLTISSPAPLPGKYYASQSAGIAPTSASVTLNFLYLMPFYVPVSHTYDRIAIRKTAAGSANYRLGIYGPVTTTPANVPLLHDAGAVNQNGIGTATITISWTLAAGMYFLAFITDTTANITQATNSQTLWSLGSTGPDDTPPAYFVDAQAYGSLPANTPNPPTAGGGTSMPLVALRA